jgi:hypothetical protein
LSNHWLTRLKRFVPTFTNYAISYLFYLHLMLHACVERFDVMCGRENILGWDEKWTRPYYIYIYIYIYMCYR